MLFRLILLLAIAGTITLFTLQNLTPVLPLVFLGSPTPALPLSWWVLGAIAAGALTTLAITSLVGLSNFLTKQAVRQVRSSSRRDSVSEPFSKTPAEKNRTAAAAAASQAKSPDAEGDAAWQDWRGYDSSPAAATGGNRTTQSAQDTDLDDWDQGMNDDWEESSSDRATPNSSPSSSTVRDRFEQPPQPTQGSYGSSYSNSYREPEPSGSGKSDISKSGKGKSDSSKSGKGKSDSGKSDSGKSDSGKTERVVDADFRVLVPPYRALEDEPAPTSSNSASNPDSWFEDEEDGDDRRSPR